MQLSNRQGEAGQAMIGIGGQRGTGLPHGGGGVAVQVQVCQARACRDTLGILFKRFAKLALRFSESCEKEIIPAGLGEFRRRLRFGFLFRGCANGQVEWEEESGQLQRSGVHPYPHVPGGPLQVKLQVGGNAGRKLAIRLGQTKALAPKACLRNEDFYWGPTS